MADAKPKPQDVLNQLNYQPPRTGWMETPVQIRKGMYCYASNPKSVNILGLPNARPWNPIEDDWKLPENWQQILHEGFKERLERFRSFKVFMDICVRCGACADKCHFFLGTGDPKNMPVLRAELLRSVYRNDFSRLGKILGQAERRAADGPPRAQGVVVLPLPVLGVPALLALLPVRHRHGRNHHHGPRAAQPDRAQHRLDRDAGRQLLQQRQPPGHPAARFQGHDRLLPRRHRGAHRGRREAEVHGERRRHPLRHAFGRRLRRPRHLHGHGLPHALPLPGGEVWSERDLEHLRLGGRQLRLLHLARDHEAPERQAVRRSQAAQGQVDPGRRVRPHVARHPPVHGHHERAGRPPGGAGEPDHRHALRERELDQDGAHRRVHRRSDPQRQARPRPEPQRPPQGHLPRFLQRCRAAWACSTSRAT